MDFGVHGTVLGRSWDDPGTLGTTRQDTVRPRLGFYCFLVDLGGPFRKIFRNIWIEKHNFFISISRLLFLMIFGSESWCLGLENQAFGKGSIAKLTFAQIVSLMIPGLIFLDFWHQFS